MHSHPPLAVAPGRHAARVLALLLLLPGAAFAQLRVDLDGAETMVMEPLPEFASGGWTLQRSQSSGLAPATSAATPLAGVPAAQSSGAVTQTMLWARRERLGLGFGVEQRWAPVASLANPFPAPAATRDAGMLVGLSWATGESSQVTWATPLLPPRSAGMAWAGAEKWPEREMRLGLDFRKRDPYAELRRGALMKFEVSRDTTVSVKPRHGRLSFTLASRW